MISFEEEVPFPVLYKRGVKGEVRVWSMELGHNESDGIAAHRVVSGILDGALTKSGWTFTEAKNTGKKNATTPYTQAVSEVNNLYQIKQERGYFADIGNIDKVEFTKPMLAQDWDKRKAKVDVTKGVYAQPKLDGIRCIARADGLWTRTGKPITSCPHIVRALATFFEDNPDVELDGELYNHDLREDFNTITSVVRKETPDEAELQKAYELIQYHIYDIVDSSQHFAGRKESLKWAFEHLFKEEYCLYLVPTEYVVAYEPLDTLYARWMEEGYEGQMIRLDTPYEHKRSNNLMKRKDFTTEEFPVLDMESGNGNWAGAIKRFIIQLPNGLTCEAVPRGSYEKLAALLASSKCPTWATVRHFGYTPDGKLRFPIVVDYGYGARVD